MATINIKHSYADRYYLVFIDGDVDSNLDEPSCTFDDCFSYTDPTDTFNYEDGYFATRQDAAAAAGNYANYLQRKFGRLEVIWS